ncbi:hypothetical protein ES703_38236 [subsurface metagenome]
MVRDFFELLGGGENTPLSFQFFFLASFQLCPTYLLKLKTQELLAAGALLLVFFQRFELFFYLIKLGGFNIKALPQLQGMGIGIQKIEMGPDIKEG